MIFGANFILPFLNKELRCSIKMLGYFKISFRVYYDSLTVSININQYNRILSWKYYFLMERKIAVRNLVLMKCHYRYSFCYDIKVIAFLKVIVWIRRMCFIFLLLGKAQPEIKTLEKRKNILRDFLNSTSIYRNLFMIDCKWSYWWPIVTILEIPANFRKNPRDLSFKGKIREMKWRNIKKRDLCWQQIISRI